MPRTISAGLEAAYQGQVIEKATFVKITRKDGVVIAFTTHDQPLTDPSDGITYTPNGAISATSIKNMIGSGIDTMEAIGAIDSDLITQEDILTGRYNQARIIIFEAMYTDMSLGNSILHTGRIGDITVTERDFNTEFRGLGQQLKQATGDSTSKTCRALRVFGAQCGASPTGFRFNKTVAVVTDEYSLTFGSDAAATEFYTGGIVKFTSGPNTDIEREVKTHTLTGGDAVLVLRQPFPNTVSVGETAQLEAGCQRRFEEDCVAKFNNGINFQGEPHLPGNDQLIQTGRAPS